MNSKKDKHIHDSRALYLDFIFLKSKERKLLEENEYLKKRLELLKYNIPIQKTSKHAENDFLDHTKKRRIRRKKSEIERLYNCKIGDCKKAYGYIYKI